MKSLIKSSSLTLLMAITLTLVGCSSGAKKDSGSSSDSMVDDAADAVSFEANGSSDDATAGPLRTVYFPFNSSELSDIAKSTLEQNAMWLKSTAGVDIQVEGHCDERGGVQFNLALGERRANAVKGYLESFGVESSRIDIVSLGKESPVSYGHDEESWSKNRRANFKITAK